MLEWQIKPLSKKSGVSDRTIVPGDDIICVVFIDELNNLDRIDVHKDEYDSSLIKGKIIGKWERTVSESPEADERAARKMALASSEDFFLSLFDESVNIQTDEIDVVKQMLSLLLERKRILRPVGRISNKMQKYIHISSKKEFLVPQKNLNQELIIKIQTQLGSIII